VDCENTLKLLLTPHNAFGAVLQKLALTNLLQYADYENKYAEDAKKYAEYAKKYAEQYAKYDKIYVRICLICNSYIVTYYAYCNMHNRHKMNPCILFNILFCVL
jgi:hypothetical protein